MRGVRVGPDRGDRRERGPGRGVCRGHRWQRGRCFYFRESMFSEAAGVVMFRWVAPFRRISAGPDVDSYLPCRRSKAYRAREVVTGISLVRLRGTKALCRNSCASPQPVRSLWASLRMLPVAQEGYDSYAHKEEADAPEESVDELPLFGLRPKEAKAHHHRHYGHGYDRKLGAEIWVPLRHVSTLLRRHSRIGRLRSQARPKTRRRQTATTPRSARALRQKEQQSRFLTQLWPKSPLG